MTKNSSLSAVTTVCDVLVVGAGHRHRRALTLHSAGINVVVVDKANFRATSVVAMDLQQVRFACSTNWVSATSVQLAHM